jgi:hypothetical protein
MRRFAQQLSGKVRLSGMFDLTLPWFCPSLGRRVTQPLLMHAMMFMRNFAALVGTLPYQVLAQMFAM